MPRTWYLVRTYYLLTYVLLTYFIESLTYALLTYVLLTYSIESSAHVKLPRFTIRYIATPDNDLWVQAEVVEKVDSVEQVE